jgi:hypothetical protein
MEQGQQHCPFRHRRVVSVVSFVVTSVRVMIVVVFERFVVVRWCVDFHVDSFAFKWISCDVGR